MDESSRPIEAEPDPGPAPGGDRRWIYSRLSDLVIARLSAIVRAGRHPGIPPGTDGARPA